MGGTRRGGPEVNIKHSGREDNERERERYRLEREREDRGGKLCAYRLISLGQISAQVSPKYNLYIFALLFSFQIGDPISETVAALIGIEVLIEVLIELVIALIVVLALRAFVIEKGAEVVHEIKRDGAENATKKWTDAMIGAVIDGIGIKKRSESALARAIGIDPNVNGTDVIKTESVKNVNQILRRAILKLKKSQLTVSIVNCFIQFSIKSLIDFSSKSIRTISINIIDCLC